MDGRSEATKRTWGAIRLAQRHQPEPRPPRSRPGTKPFLERPSPLCSSRLRTMLLRAIGVGEVLSALGLQRAAACAAAAACTAAGHPRSLSSSAAAAQADLNEPTGGHGRYVSSPPSGAGTIIEDTRLQPASPVRPRR